MMVLILDEAAQRGVYPCQLPLKKEKERKENFERISIRDRKKKGETDPFRLPRSVCMGCRWDWEPRQHMMP